MKSSSSIGFHGSVEASLLEPAIRELSSHGLRFHRFTIAHDSPHTLADWDWNQRDLLHVPFVHGSFRAGLLRVEGDHLSAVMLQDVFGFRLPLLNAYHHPSPNRRVYGTTLGPFVLLVEASLDALPSQGTHVRTAYAVGSSPPFHLLHRFIERFLRRNYKKVFTEDEPLRQRRSELRQWGYRFKSDTNASYSNSTRLEENNVVPPPIPVSEMSIPLVELHPDTERLIGRSDHMGFRIVHSSQTLTVYPRLCPHQGACLDNPLLRQDDIPTCPWHGRPIQKICSFSIDSKMMQVHDTPTHQISFDGRELRFRPLPTPRVP